MFSDYNGMYSFIRKHFALHRMDSKLWPTLGILKLIRYQSMSIESPIDG